MKIIGKTEQGFIVHATARELNQIAGRDPTYRQNDDLLKVGVILGVGNAWEAMRQLAGMLDPSRENIVWGLQQMVDKLRVSPTEISQGPPEPSVEPLSDEAAKGKG